MKQTGLKNPASMGKHQIGSNNPCKGSRRGNAPWLKVRRRFRKSQFRGM